MQRGEEPLQPPSPGAEQLNRTRRRPPSPLKLETSTCTRRTVRKPGYAAKIDRAIAMIPARPEVVVNGHSRCRAASARMGSRVLEFSHFGGEATCEQTSAGFRGLRCEP